MDVLDAINKLRDRLWMEFGDVLIKPYSQDEIHMTYYIGELLRRHRHEPAMGTRIGTAYTEVAMHAAFIAGLRIGVREADAIAKRTIDERMADAIATLRGDA